MLIVKGSSRWALTHTLKQGTIKTVTVILLSVTKSTKSFLIMLSDPRLYNLTRGFSVDVKSHIFGCRKSKLKQKQAFALVPYFILQQMTSLIISVKCGLYFLWSGTSTEFYHHSRDICVLVQYNAVLILEILKIEQIKNDSPVCNLWQKNKQMLRKYTE